jgi:hypothetical protein
LSLALLAFVLLVFCGGAGGLLLWKWGSAPAADKAEARSTPHGKEEEAVKKYILDHANDPKSVEFVTWGPHDLKGELAALAKEVSRVSDELNGVRLENEKAQAKTQNIHVPAAPGFPKAKREDTSGPILRVRWREKNKAGALEVYDSLFTVRDGKVIDATPQRNGDEWLVKMRDTLRQWLEQEQKQLEREREKAKNPPPKSNRPKPKLIRGPG